MKQKTRENLLGAVIFMFGVVVPVIIANIV